jgi:hypothetical protein
LGVAVGLDVAFDDRASGAAREGSKRPLQGGSSCRSPGR